MQFWQVVRTILRLVRGHRYGMVVVVLLSLCSSLTESIGITLFLPLLQSITNQDVSAYQSIRLIRLLHFNWQPSPRTALLIPVLIGAAIILRSLLTHASNSMTSRLKTRVAHSLRQRLMERIFVMDAAAYERENVSMLWNVVAGETWRFSEAVGLVCNLVSGAGVAMGFVVFLCLTSIKLTLAAMVSVGVISLGLRFLSRSVVRWSEAAVKANAELSEALVDNLDGLREIQAFSLQSRRIALFAERSRKVQQLFFRMEMFSGLTNPISETVYAMLLVLILVLSPNDPSRLPTIFLFLMILFRLQPSVRGFESARSNLCGAAGPVQEMARFIGDGSLSQPWSGTRVAGPLRHAIEFQDVTFRYPLGEVTALRGVTLSLRKGQITAVVGSSGAGKTTLVQLLLGFRHCESGRILLDGVPLDTFDMDSWRHQVGTAFQDAYLFATTVRENIRYGLPSASNEEIEEAARLAHADEFILELPLAYETRLGEGGTTLSGGQRQRLALARALLRRPSLLILDEATNALDSVAESTIQERLEVVGDMTVLVIAHRFSALRNADHVIVMDGGEIVEQGTPDELLQRNGLFARMSRLQSRGQLA